MNPRRHTFLSRYAPLARGFAVVLVLLPLVTGFEVLRRENRLVTLGNQLLKEGKAKEALDAYNRAVEEGLRDPGLDLARGSALASLGRNDEAVQAFLQASGAKDTPGKVSAFFNLGNTFFRGEKFDEAVEAYKRALTLDARHTGAKWNLELALRKKQEKEKEKEKEKKEQDDKKKDDQKKPEDQEKKDEQKPDDKQEPKPDEQQKKDAPPKPDDKQDQKPDEPKKDEPQKPEEQKAPEPPKPEPQPGGADKQPPPPPPSAQQAAEAALDAVLDNLEKSPKDLERERAKLRAVRRARPVKDW